MDVKNVANIQATIQMNNPQNVGRNVRIGVQNQTRKAVQEEEKKKLSPQEMEKLLNDLKEKLSMLNTQLKIEIEKIGDGEEIPVIKVIDTKTKEVIRQIPPEYMIKIAKYIDEITGLLLREKA
ncbi:MULTISPECIES: flagellar protein FlaG [unclassified Desulfurobacterium]|uniref:flagellar protein FlaG n=1 Tax=Desulfurobacterium sp. TC5-1 TaxID=1158318 RepID=UPI0003B422CA|nr:flagellar protein FlaG [Desulfurobacterium sp. TC5-1]